MNDPHVVSLTYTVLSPENIDYSKAAPLITSIDGFDIEIANHTLTIRPN